MAERFKHLPVDLGYDDLACETTADGRKYITPTGEIYPSITTVLGSLSKDSIEQWKNRVGQKEADRVSHHASIRGTIVHDLLERYINGEDIDKTKLMPHHRRSLNLLSEVMDNRLTDVYAQEVPLYSDHLKVAGRTDLIGRFDNVKSVVDFKTSAKIKKREWISNYFIQGSAYAIMFEERTGIAIPNIVIVMDIDNHKPVVFKEHRDNWTRQLIDAIRNHKR